MPVLATMTLLSIHRQRSGGFPQPFTDPQELRRRLARGLADAGPERREEALAIADEIDALLAAHRAKTEAILATYADNMHSRYRDAAELGDHLAPLDEARLETLLGIVQQRQHLRGLLTTQQWSAVFDQPPDASA